jgi:O-antigen/teichoic acid export membrane protein
MNMNKSAEKFFNSQPYLKKITGPGIAAVLARGASGAFIVRIIGTGLMFVSHMIMARLLGSASYGNFAYAMTWLSVLALVGNLGLDNASLRFVAEYNGTQKWNLMKGFLRRSIQISSGVSLFLGLTVAGIIWILHGRLAPELANCLWVMCIILPFFTLLGIKEACLRALKYIALSQFAGQVLRPLLLLFGLGVLYFLNEEILNATVAMIINLAGFLCALMFLMLVSMKALPKSINLSRPEYDTGNWARVAMPMLLINAMLQVENQADVLILGFFLDSSQIGLYSAAKKITILISFGYFSVNAIAAPMISELWHQGETKKLQRMLTLAAKGILAFTLPASICMIIFGKQILSLFSQEFTAAYWPMVILTLGQIVNSLAGSVGALMIMTGHQKNASIFIAIGMITNITLSIILIPKFSIIGAAISMSASLIIWNLLMFIYVLKKIRLNPSILKWE